MCPEKEEGQGAIVSLLAHSTFGERARVASRGEKGQRDDCGGDFPFEITLEGLSR